MWTIIIILQIIIPLSLYVTIELTKISQVWLIHNDPLMWDEVHEKRVECRALNITEELGQVQYMFCDKTGTLTENKMVFKRCSIAGQDFGHNSFSCRDSSRAVIPTNPRLEAALHQLELSLVVEPHPVPALAALAQEFFLLLAVCNTVIVASHPHRDTMNASGVICETTPGTADSTLTRPTRNATNASTMSAANATTLTTISASPPTPSPASPSRSSSPSPPPSIVSTVSSTAALTSRTDHTDSGSTPLTNAKPYKRPRFLDFRPLSPIQIFSKFNIPQKGQTISLKGTDLQQVQYPSEETEKENNHDIGYNFERKMAMQVSSWQKKLLWFPPSVPGTAGHPT